MNFSPHLHCTGHLFSCLFFKCQASHFLPHPPGHSFRTTLQIPPPSLSFGSKLQGHTLDSISSYIPRVTASGSHFRSRFLLHSLGHTFRITLQMPSWLLNINHHSVDVSHTSSFSCMYQSCNVSINWSCSWDGAFCVSSCCYNNGWNLVIWNNINMFCAVLLVRGLWQVAAVTFHRLQEVFTCFLRI